MIKNILLIVVFILPSCATYCNLPFNQNKQSSLSSLVNTTLETVPSISFAAGLGLFSGIITAAIQSKAYPSLVLPSFFVLWPLEMYLRDAALNDINEQMNKKNIKHNRITMYWIARITSWIGWYSWLNSKHYRSATYREFR